MKVRARARVRVRARAGVRVRARVGVSVRVRVSVGARVGVGAHLRPRVLEQRRRHARLLDVRPVGVDTVVG